MILPLRHLDAYDAGLVVHHLDAYDAVVPDPPAVFLVNKLSKI